jgi:hypothetical protein
MEDLLHIISLLDNDLAEKKIHCPTRLQVPPVLESIFIFRTLTPSAI